MTTFVLLPAGEPASHSDPRVVLANCPFHALARAQLEMVCRMNHALPGGVADTLDPHCPRVGLEPDRNRCCVVLAPADYGPAEDGR